MNQSLASFTKLYKLSKTLRFELKPCYETSEKIRELNALEKDTTRVRYYQTMKDLMDVCHKQHIEKTLKKVSIDWSDLATCLDAFLRENNDKTKSALETCQNLYRKDIVAALTKDAAYKELTAATPKDLIKKELKKIAETDEEKEAIKNFEGFATYFVGYQETRKNIYSCEPEMTAISYRVVHENFPKFLANIKAFKTIQKEMPEIISDATKSLTPILDGLSLEEIFDISFYNCALTQTGITYYNEVLGGRSGEAGSQKIQGLNELTNLYFHQHPEKKHLRRHVVMVPLFKQILSDRVSASFVPQQFESDEAVLSAVKEFWTAINAFETDEGPINVITYLSGLITNLFAADSAYDKSQIYIATSVLTDFSKDITGDWSALTKAAFDYAETIYGDAAKPGNKKKIDQWIKRPYSTLQELEESIPYLPKSDDCGAPKSYADVIKAKTEILFAATPALTSLCDDGYHGENLKSEEGEQVVETLKVFLDATQDLYHAIKIFEVPSEYARDLSFYAHYDKLIEPLRLIIPLYNRIRNYVTQKVSEETKYKLMFNVPTFLNGWDKNKEKDNAGVIFIRDGLYYLGILNKSHKPNFVADGTGSPGDYQKMVYKYLPGPNKMLPKVFFSKDGRAAAPKSLVEKYDAGFHKKGKDFDKKFMHQLVDFFKAKIEDHPDWKHFNFVFSPTKSYDDISQFYKEVAEQGYKLTFESVSEAQIRTCVQNGQLFLFQIYNKDFAPGATGTPNLHTLYWKALFDTDNLSNLVVKLNGEAEVFYRPAQIKTPFKHALGEKLVNRICTDGTTIPERIHKEIADFVNGVNTAPLSSVAERYRQKAVIRDVTHEIIKDRRYTEDKFKFHVPITLNANASDYTMLNEQVQAFVRKNPDVKIIGLDRGERHLLYLTLIDRNGNLLKQKSFNIVDVNHGEKTQAVNYHEKLKHREDERQGARKNWKQIGAIKDLKEGYLSIVIHEIVKLMIEENAIIVLEDLNFGFKRGRFAVERQVYQKFEKMLIDKLNYLAFKNVAATAPGGILNAYQLTSKFESFQKLGKQSGVLFYIPAAYTSKIDPTTGFVNLLNPKYENITSAQDFLKRFSAIRYNAEADYFEFDLDYTNFKVHVEDYKKKWTVCTYGTKRFYYHNATKTSEEVNVTECLKKLLEKESIPYAAGQDIKNAVAAINTVESLKTLLWLLKVTLSLRHSNSATEEDFILSPVRNADGSFFNSSTIPEEATLPRDADANGAYHIALKGLYVLKQIDESAPDKKLKLEKVEHHDWLKFAQTRN